MACERDAATGKAMNVARGARHTWLDPRTELARIIGKETWPVLAAPRPGAVKHSLAAIEVARQALGYEPPVGRTAGLWRTCARPAHRAGHDGAWLESSCPVGVECPYVIWMPDRGARA